MIALLFDHSSINFSCHNTENENITVGRTLWCKFHSALLMKVKTLMLEHNMVNIIITGGWKWECFLFVHNNNFGRL